MTFLKLCNFAKCIKIQSRKNSHGEIPISEILTLLFHSRTSGFQRGAMLGSITQKLLNQNRDNRHYNDETMTMSALNERAYRHYDVPTTINDYIGFKYDDFMVLLLYVEVA